MTTAFLYLVTAALSVWLIHRFVTPIGRRYAFVLILLPLLFTGRALLTNGVYAPIDLPYITEPLKSLADDYGVDRTHNHALSDVYCLNIPWKYAVRVAYSEGEWALWNPYSFAGDILAASAQPTPYDPVFLLSLLLPMGNSLTFLAAITLFIAGLLAFAFLRELRSSELASLIGATSWMFATFIVFWLEWVITPTTMWMPLVLLAVRRIVRERTLHAAGILTIAFVMMLLNGHPESALHIVTVGMLWAAVELKVNRYEGIVRAAALGVGAGAVALLLTAIYMMPIIEALPQTAEHTYRESVFAYEQRSAPWPLAIQRLQSQFVPFIFGLPHRQWPVGAPFIPLTESTSIGSVALALALFGAWRSRWRGRWIALAMVILGMVFSIELAPFSDWIAVLPLYDIALNGRLGAVAALGFAMLAAFGADSLRDHSEVIRFAVVAVVTAALHALLIRQLWPSMIERVPEPFLRTESATVIVPLLIVATFAVLLRNRPVQLAVAALAVIASQRTLEMGDFYPTLPAKAAYPKVPILEKLPKGEEPYRIVGYGHTLIPNTATLYRLEDIRGYQAMTYRPMKESQPFWSVLQPVWWNRVSDLRPAYISMLNTRFAIAETSFSPPDGWREFARQDGTVIWENMKVLPRAFVPQNVALAPNPVKDFGERIFNIDDFGRWSFIEIPEGKMTTSGNGPGTVTIRRAGLNAFDLEASMEAPAWVVVSQTAWDGWRVYVDGKPTKARRANHTVIAFQVDRGKHSIHLKYYPHSFVVGRVITLLTIVALIVFAVVLRRRTRAALTPS